MKLPHNPSTPWRSVELLSVDSMLEDADESECLSIAMDETALTEIARHLHSRMSKNGLPTSPWYERYIENKLCASFIMKLASKSDELLKKSKNHRLKLALFTGGHYQSVEMIDWIAENSEDIDLVVAASRVCSISVLRKISKKKDALRLVKTIAYERLGPVECLDEMINDKYAKNREMGYNYAPHGYPPLEEKALTEIAKGPTIALIKKLSSEYLPMLMANRNVLKNRWIASYLEKRMNSGK